ncbi:hypothetical protein ACP70R_041727 [Stipagrostis hirtigluma subsp. patula]
MAAPYPDGGGGSPTSSRSSRYAASGVEGKLQIPEKTLKERDVLVEVKGEGAPAPADRFDTAGLPEAVLRNVARCGYEILTPLQRYVIPVAMAGRDLLSCAKTGSGKKVAFCLSIVSGLVAAGARRGVQGDRTSSDLAAPRALVLAPSTELAQINEVAEKFSFGTGLKVVVAFDGTEMHNMPSDQDRGVDILITTPGLLVDNVKGSNVSLKAVEYIVMDDADNMMDVGLEPQIRKIIDMIHLPEKSATQTMLFCAVFTPELQVLVSDIISNYVKVEFVNDGEGGPQLDITQKQSVGVGKNEQSAWASHLPFDILLEIARCLRHSRRDVQCMRCVCPHWRSAVPNTNGPWLVLSRAQDLDAMLPEEDMITVLEMLDRHGEGPATGTVCCFCPPPKTSTCWGAAYGLLAIRLGVGNDVLLFDLNDGSTRLLPDLPDGATPCGIYFNEIPVQTLGIISDLNPRLLHFVALDFDLEEGIWEPWYPANANIVMESLVFGAGLHFAGTTADTVVIERLPERVGADEAVIHIAVPDASGAGFEPWASHNPYIFSCSGSIFLCILLRAEKDVQTVRAVVFSVRQRSPGEGYSLDRTFNIGEYAVYLGANQALVLPGDQKSLVQHANCVYVVDDDGIVRNDRILMFDVASGDSVAIFPFPRGVAISECTHGAWVAPGPLPPFNRS